VDSGGGYYRLKSQNSGKVLDVDNWSTADGGKVSLAYEDSAPPFNPFARATREMLEALAETRREGGLGVILAHGLSTSSDYAYVFGRNRIRLKVN